jgi:metal-responsive CopG/Arc/MetJ family transcriptional regulator
MPGTATPDHRSEHLVRADLRLEQELLDIADAIAHDEDRTRSQVLRRAVRQGLTGHSTPTTATQER